MYISLWAEDDASFLISPPTSTYPYVLCSFHHSRYPHAVYASSNDGPRTLLFKGNYFGGSPDTPVFSLSTSTATVREAFTTLDTLLCAYVLLMTSSMERGLFC